MQENPGSGYFVPATQIAPLLPDAARAAYLEQIANNDEEAVEQILSEVYPPNLPKFVDIRIPSDTDTFDDPDTVRTGVMYLVFAEDDLYIRTETEAHKNLLRHNVVPHFAAYTIWG